MHNMQPNKNRAAKIRKILKARYPDVKTQLKHNNAFELLIATILSAQCTDKQVNSVTPKLFAEFRTPHEFAEAPITAVEMLIRSTGYFHNKAKNIQNCCRALIRDHKGEVPVSLEQLVKLPGVGRKTANVVLGAAFGIPGVVVDTHVARISRRLGLTGSKNPVNIESDLMNIIPKNEWNDFGLHLIYFGREICKARNPVCRNCPLETVCESPDKALLP